MSPAELALRQVERLLARARAGSDVVLASVLVAILGALLVPLPPWLLDAGLAVSLAASLSLLVAALRARTALQVASFPTVLLLTTLLRLSLEVSSTRLALSEGQAGQVIDAFGDFVVRGDYVVGAVVFAILTLVQFLVVTRGAERVAEVAARFTLDAMPGKQLSIDADLRAGAIGQDQARARRRELERESQLFGAMDGAMKFVKGDAIAGLVITAVNLLGGVAIGALERGLSAGEAARTYALLAIGDALAAQLPSLAIAVAAGLVVTRVASEREEDTLGTDIGAQLFGHHRALWVVAALCAALGLVPGMPLLTFGALAGGLGVVGLVLRRAGARPPPAPGRAHPAGEGARPASAPWAAGGPSPLVLDLAPDLDWLAEAEGQRFVKADLERVRERLFTELGVRAPAFRVRTGAPLPPRGYRLGVDEVPAGAGQLPPGEAFSAPGAAELALAGVAPEPVLDALGRAWVPVGAEAAAALAGLGQAPVPARELVADHVLVLLRRRAWLLLGVEEVQSALGALEASAPALVKEALRKVPLPLLAEVLRTLVREQVSIRNLKGLLDALVAPSAEGDAAQLAERCRVALARQLSHQHAAGGTLLAYLVDPAVEEALRTTAAALEPSLVGAILEGVRRLGRPGRAVLLASPDVRRVLRRLLEGPFPEVPVLTYGELDPELQVRPVGRLVAPAPRT